MKGLLLKDFYQTVKLCRFYLLIDLFCIVLVLTGATAPFFLVYPALFAGMLPVTLLSQDEREKWEVFSGALPYTRGQLVSAKYLMGLLYGLLVILLTSAAYGARLLIDGAFQMQEFLILLSLLLLVALAPPSLLLPLIFKLGTEKGRILYYFLVGFFTVSAAALMSGSSDGQLPAILESAALLPAILIPASAVLYAASWLLSIQFYKNREL